MKFERNISVSKQMIACFFVKFGHVTTTHKDRKTVTLTGMSTSICLKSSRHGVNVVPELVSVVCGSTMTMPACTWQL